MHAVIHRLSTWLSTALSVHIAIYEIYSEDTTGHRITTSTDAGMMFVGSYRKKRGYVSSDTEARAFRYEHPRLPIRAAKGGLGMAICGHCVCHPIKNLGKNVEIQIIASIFADIFIYYDVIRQAADLKAHELLARECDPQERSDALRHREEAESKYRLVDRMRVWKHKPSDVIAESISIGDIRVTPFSNCHSILHKDADAEL